MISRLVYKDAKKRAGEAVRSLGLPFTTKELGRIEVADFGLSHLDQEGTQILTMVRTERLCVKLLVLFPQQTVPEHWHPPIGSDPGKEETIRVLCGYIYLYLPGESNLTGGRIPAGKEPCYTVRHEVRMQPGDQLTIGPGAKHWFQAGPDGALLYSFSTTARDTLDQFSDPNVIRITKIVG